MEKVACSWSGGKESTLALHEVHEGERLEVVELLTMVSPATDRTFSHGVRTKLIERQAEELGVPVELVPIPQEADEYANRMTGVFSDLGERGIERLVLGDVFREDGDDYRAEAMDRTGFKSYCPLLDEDTGDLVDRLLDAGFSATTVCVEADLGREFLGRQLDRTFLEELPDDADPAGEDGEYHTFVHDGPLFDDPVAFETGEVVEREVGDATMLYLDLVPA